MNEHLNVIRIHNCETLLNTNNCIDFDVLIT